MREHALLKPLGLAMFLSLLFVSVAPAENLTKLHNIRFGMHGTYTRLVFDAEGERPSQIGPPGSEGVVITFAGLEAADKLAKDYGENGSAVSGVRFRSGTEVLISLRNPSTVVKSAIAGSDPPRPGHYRLILDFYPQASAKASGSKPEPAAKQPPDWTPLPESGTNPAKEDPRQQPPPEQAPPVVTETDKAQAQVLFGIADATFVANQANLAQAGNEVIAQYSSALQMDPRAPQAAVALYRCGLSASAANNASKAIKYLQQAVTEFPNDPIVPQCWLQLGKIYHQRQSYIEAIEALRAALRTSADPQAHTEANYLLGRDLSLVGAHKEAMDALTQCMNEAPSLYLQHPDLLRYLGESSFSTQQFASSQDYLFHYLNLEQDTSDRDLILAKIAEVLLQEGEQILAKRLYGYIQLHYQDSEGDIISKIRKAELIENQDHGNQTAALTIYQELAKKNLSPPLRRLISFKLASWDWRHANYEKSLGLIEETLRDKKENVSLDEFVALREKVLVDWIKKAFADKDYARVVQLYEAHGTELHPLQLPEVESAAAESYNQLKKYPQALSCYETLLTSPAPKNDDWTLKAAQLAYQLGDVDKAFQLCQKVSAQPLELPKSELLGKIAFWSGKYAEASKYFAKVLPKEADYGSAAPDTLCTYGESLVELGKNEAALPVLTAALAREGNNSERKVRLMGLLTRCYKGLNQMDKAVETMEALVTFTPSEEQRNQLNYDLSRYYQSAGQIDKAKEKLTQLMGASQSFWKTVAEEQLTALQLGKPTSDAQTATPN